MYTFLLGDLVHGGLWSGRILELRPGYRNEMSMALSSSSRAANQGSSSSINSMNNQGHNNYYPHPHNSYHPTRRGPRPSQFIVELSQCLLDFVVQLLPSENEVAVKDDVRCAP